MQVAFHRNPTDEKANTKESQPNPPSHNYENFSQLREDHFSSRSGSISSSVSARGAGVGSGWVDFT